jgi:hypothetical protein
MLNAAEKKQIHPATAWSAKDSLRVPTPILKVKGTRNELQIIRELHP